MENIKSGSENQEHISGIKIDKLIEKYGAEKQSKGLANLLNLGEPVEKSVPTTQEPMLLAEILRVVRERHGHMNERFDGLEKQLNSVRKFHDRDKRLLASLICATLVIGLLLGNLLTPQEKTETPIVVKKIQTPVSPVQKNLMVTNKFVNMRDKNSPKANKLTTISPAQTVEVLGRKGGWVNISYHNKLTGKTYKGFVWDEFLTSIK